MKDDCKFNLLSVLRGSSVATFKDSAKLCSNQIPLIANFSCLKTSIRRNSLRVTQINYCSKWCSMCWEITFGVSACWLALTISFSVYMDIRTGTLCIYIVSAKTTHTNSIAIYPYTHVCVHAYAFAFKIIFFKILEETVFWQNHEQISLARLHCTELREKRDAACHTDLPHRPGRREGHRL